MSKAWTEIKGPIKAGRTNVERAEAINALLIRPIALLPLDETDNIKPFSIGVWNDIRSLLKPGATTSQLRRATSAYTHAKRYYLACAQPDAIRHDIDGQPVEAVSAEDRLAAQVVFQKLNNSRQEPSSVAPAMPIPAPVVSKASLIRAALLGQRKSA